MEEPREKPKPRPKQRRRYQAELLALEAKVELAVKLLRKTEGLTEPHKSEMVALAIGMVTE